MNSLALIGYPDALSNFSFGTYEDLIEEQEVLDFMKEYSCIVEIDKQIANANTIRLRRRLKTRRRKIRAELFPKAKVDLLASFESPNSSMRWITPEFLINSQMTPPQVYLADRFSFISDEE